MPTTFPIPPRAAVREADELRCAEVLSAALASGVLSDADPVALFYDLTEFWRTCAELSDAFPPGSLHGFAIKANPLVAMVREAHAMGLGAECASMGEVAVARSAGVPSDMIVLDAPAKTTRDLQQALSWGLTVNLDNYQEVARVAKLFDPTKHQGVIGLRLNTQHGAGQILETSTASASSKFGVPLREDRPGIIDAYKSNAFLRCVHVHVGSQGCSVDQLVEGARQAVLLANEVNAACPGQVTHVDIGGGLSVDYLSDGIELPFSSYAAMLRESVPDLFNYTIITEFGRRLSSHSGWVASRVEYTKSAGGRNIVTTHAGADIFMRPVYAPDKWSHRISVYDANGKPKSSAGEMLEQDFAGPLCFSGDILARGRVTPRCVPGDWIVVRDAGAYTLSMYSRHTSQYLPLAAGYEEEHPANLRVLKKAETPEDVVRFWS